MRHSLANILPSLRPAQGGYGGTSSSSILKGRETESISLLSKKDLKLVFRKKCF